MRYFSLLRMPARLDLPQSFLKWPPACVSQVASIKFVFPLCQFNSSLNFVPLSISQPLEIEIRVWWGGKEGAFYCYCNMVGITITSQISSIYNLKTSWPPLFKSVLILGYSNHNIFELAWNLVWGWRTCSWSNTETSTDVFCFQSLILGKHLHVSYAQRSVLDHWVAWP